MSSSAERLVRLVTPRWLFVSDDYAETIVRNRVIISLGTLLLLIVTLSAFTAQYYFQINSVTLTETFVTAYLSQYADNPNVDCVRVAAVSGQIRFSGVEPEFGCYSTPKGTCANFTMDYWGSGLRYNSTHYASYEDCVSAYTPYFTNATGALKVLLRTSVEPCSLDVRPPYLPSTLGDGVYMKFPTGTVNSSCSELIEPFDTDAWTATAAPSIVAQMCSQFKGDTNPPFLCTSSTSVPTLTAVSSATNFAGFVFSISCIVVIVLFWLIRVVQEQNRKSSFLKFLMMDGFFRFRFDDRVRPYFGLKTWCCFLLLFPLLLLGAFGFVFLRIYDEAYTQTFLSNSLIEGKDCQMLSSYTDSRGALGYQTLQSNTIPDEANNISISYLSYTRTFVNAYFPYHSDCVSVWTDICLSVPLSLQSSGGDSDYTFVSLSSLGNPSTADVVFGAEISQISYFNILAGDGQGMTLEKALGLWNSTVCSANYNTSIVSMNCAPFLDNANPPFICSQTVRVYTLWGAIGQSFAVVIAITTACAVLVPKFLGCFCGPRRRNELDMVPMNRIRGTVDDDFREVPKSKKSSCSICTSILSKLPFPKAFTTVKNDIPVVGYEFIAVILSVLIYAFCIGVLVVSFMRSPAETTELVLSETNLGDCTQLEFSLFACKNTFKYSIWTRLSSAFGNASLAFAALSFLMIILLNSAAACTSNENQRTRTESSRSREDREPRITRIPAKSDASSRN